MQDITPTRPKPSKKLRGILRPVGYRYKTTIMKPPEADDPLSRALATWRVEPKPDPNFRPAVWQRIQRSAQDSWAGYVRRHLAAWSAVALVTVMAAGWAGVSAGRARLTADRAAMVVAYLVELDPRVQAALRP